MSQTVTDCPGQGAISIKGLVKRFGDVEVLKNIDVEIKKGEVVCIIGPSGSGKTTMLRCVNLLEQPLTLALDTDFNRGQGA